jgi:hypothetical protein
MEIIVLKMIKSAALLFLVGPTAEGINLDIV